jgi:hypothetical protein
MKNQANRSYLSALLIFSGLTFIVGVPLLMRLWPAGFAWTPRQSEYEQMILGVYVTLGIFLLLAARAPARHRSLILFAGWSSVIHGAIMGIQSVVDATERTHLIGDVPALLILGFVLVALAPRQTEATYEGSSAEPSGGQHADPDQQLTRGEPE